MDMISLITNTHEYALGTLQLSLYSDKNLIGKYSERRYKKGVAVSYFSTGHEIEIISFQLKPLAYPEQPILDSQGWIVRIIKSNDTIENLVLRCELINPKMPLEGSPETGECLDSIGIEDAAQNWVMNIGTEDSEMLQLRAENDDWFPNRLATETNLTKFLDLGLEATISQLHKGEKIYLHYLSAIAAYVEEKVGPWLAVDKSKEELEKYIGQK